MNFNQNNMYSRSENVDVIISYIRFRIMRLSFLCIHIRMMRLLYAFARLLLLLSTIHV